ncbi:MAG: sigma-70 family RNA polymerase sigma factor [Phycisphaerales bacterium]|nr:sigma-70 family RNA polymerase sigma factor [Phycisphaerales bacterium]
MSQEVFNPEWVSACLQGDQLAWETLVRHFAPLVHSIPRRLGLTPEESDDVFQTSFTILYQRLASIDDPQSLPKWITTTTTRECWRTLRRRRKSLSIDADQGPLEASDVSDPLDALSHDQAVARVWPLMDARCQDLLRLLYATEPTPSYEEISRALGIAVGTIGPRRARCLKALCELLDGADGQ